MTQKFSINKFPGASCDFYYQGHCTYEEILNPGLNESWQCVALKIMEIFYEESLNRMESFKLEEKHIGPIMDKLMQNKIESTKFPECKLTSNLFFECPENKDGICIGLLPICEGVCPQFKQKNNVGSI